MILHIEVPLPEEGTMVSVRQKQQHIHYESGNLKKGRQSVPLDAIGLTLGLSKTAGKLYIWTASC